MRISALEIATLALPFLQLANAHSASAAWPPERQREILDKTLAIRFAPDLAPLSPEERSALAELLQVGAIFQRVYEDSRHSQALAAGAAAQGDLATLYRLFQGPIATTLDNRREPFLDVAPETPGKNVWPLGIEAAEVDRFLAAHPEERDAILGERTAVRRADGPSLARDRTALARHPALVALHPGLEQKLAALAEHPDPARLYAVPYAVAWADEMVAAEQHLFAAAAAIERVDSELARYLRNRGRDLLSNDYESGDASWVTGRFGQLNAQLGAYETYDDALFGVKAFYGASLLLRDTAATAELEKTLGGLQEVEDALPTPEHKRVRSEIPVGVYQVIADFGQARGTNTATILPNDPLFSHRYGRIILLRENVMTHPELFTLAERRFRAAVAPAHRDELAIDGGFQRTLWHEVGHYLGPDRTVDGRTLDQALGAWADALEEMKADLVSLFAVERFAEQGRVSAERRRAVEADGILRTLQSVRPRRDQPYQTMQLAQFNDFLDRGLLAADAAGRLEIHYDRYDATVRALLAEVMALQRAGDPAAAEAFFTRWTGWTGELHEPLAARLREAEGPRYRLVRYATLGE